MNAGELRTHLDLGHGYLTRGWSWGDMVRLHGHFHAATRDVGLHHHDPDVAPGTPPPVAAAGGLAPGHVVHPSGEAEPTAGAEPDPEGGG